MPRQLAFNLPVKEALGRDDFFVSAANAAAVAAVEDWAQWPQGKLALIGPPGSGKTHLAQVWANDTGARVAQAADLAATDLADLDRFPRAVVEDADQVAGNPAAERALFHLHNLIAAADGRLLLTARTAPNRWPLTLPDLASRMQATAITTLDPPDDALLSAVLVKLFADRQLIVPPAIIPYLALRMTRSFASARSLVDRIDRRALAEGRKVTRAMVAEVLDMGAEGGQ